MQVNGVLAFTFEVSATNDWELQSCARYAHNIEYIINNLIALGFKILKQQKFHPRKQDNNPVNGCLVISQKI